MLKRKILTASLLAITASSSTALFAKPEKNISLQQIGRFETGVFDESAAEIVAFDAASQQLYVINADAKTVDILSLADPSAPALVGVIDVAAELPESGGVNSVAVHDGVVAIAVENDNKQADGWAAFYTTAGDYLNHVPAGALPDMITFTHNGQYVLVANEGEPSDDYSIDPEGSISVIDLRNGVLAASVKTAGFGQFNGGAPAGVRISGPGASVAQDLEPEYITTSFDSRTAWVTLQENNALAIVDIRSATVEKLVGLGNKDHSQPGAGLDASNQDDAINIQPWPVLGTYMPDSIDSYKIGRSTYLVTANEGDGREYIYQASEADCASAGHVYDDGDCFSHLDEARIKDIELDPVAFPNAAELQASANLGRLKIISTEGDIDNDGDYDQLHSFGARSITIWNTDGQRLADTGDVFEQVTALALPDDFNSSNDENGSFDDRSDDKGPEPEGVVVGKIGGNHYAFVGLERVGGIMIFDISQPASPRFVDYVNNRDFSVEDVEQQDAGDLGPEGLVFIKPEDSPNGEALLVVGSEVSGSTTVYQVIRH